MSDPPKRRSIPRPIWRALQVALAAILGSAILFVALTRTDVGRDGIRSQLETAFSERLQGSFTIGSLHGTLIDNFVATDIEVRAPDGRTVLTVDSIVAEPRWANLLTSELSLQSLTIIRPQVRAHRDSSGSWDLMRAMSRTDPTEDTGTPLDLSFARIAVQDGRIVTTRDGAPPSSVDANWLFDYTRTTAADVSVQGSIQRANGNGVLDIEDASLRLPDPDVDVSSLSASLQYEPSGWSAEGIDLSLDTTRIRADVSAEAAHRASTPPTFNVQIDRSRLAHTEIQRLVPRLPVSDVVTVEGQVIGTSDRFDLQSLTVTHDASFATVTGTLSRTSRSRDVSLQLTDSELTADHVRDVWPNLPHLPDSSLTSIHVEGTLDGTASFAQPTPRFDLTTQLRAESELGTIEGSLAIQRSTSPLSYDGELEADSVNLAPFTDRLDLPTRLNGQLTFDGHRGASGFFTEGTADLSLSRSRFGRRLIASANGTLTITDGRAEGSVLIRQPNGGTVDFTGRAKRIWTRPNYTGVASASDLNLSAEDGPIPPTRLNGRVTLQGAGKSWDSLEGTAVVDIDSSRVLRGTETVALPPHSTTLQLADPDSSAPRLKVSGSVVSLTADGTTLGPTLWSASRAWGGTLRHAFGEILDKPGPVRRSELDPSGVASALSPEDTFSLHEKWLFSPLLSRPSPRVEATAHLEVHDADVLHAWWPSFPESAKNLTASTSVNLSSDSVHVSGEVSAATLQVGPTKASDASVQYDLSGTAGAPLAESINASIEASARRMTVGSVPLSQPGASLSFAARAGSLRVTVDSIGIVGPTEVSATVQVTPERNELEIYKARTTLQGQTWRNDAPSTVAAYSDMLVVSPLTVTRPHPQTSEVQALQIGGQLSARPTDTLSVSASNLYLPPFSRALEMPNVVGGELTGSVSLTGAQPATVVEGDAQVRHLSYDRRVLGTLDLQASYTTDSPDLSLAASLVSDTTEVDSITGPPLAPDHLRTVEPNDLSISGRYRLPEWTHSASATDSSLPEQQTLDFDVDIKRADLFFFRYIFEDRVANVRGYTAGYIHVGGHLRDPVFNADLRVSNGFVHLPRFGLEYQVRGPITVDRRGIYLDDLALEDDEGSAAVQGGVLFNDYEFFSFNLSGTLDGLTVMDVSRSEDLPFYGHIRASGPVTLTGTLPDANLRSNRARTTPDSELYIPVSGGSVQDATGFIVFADSTGQIPDLQSLTRRENILADRPEGEPSFIEGLNIDINVSAPEGSTVNLVFDPVVGDVVTAVGSGRVQLLRQEGDFQVYGDFNASSGTYLFTAGEVFVRRFSIREGTITWDGDPINARLDLQAEYRTRASTSGLSGFENYQGRIPVTVGLGITGRVATPQVDLGLAITRSEENNLVGTETLDAILNQPALQTEYATSVLLTNTFLLTTRGETPAGEENNRLTAAGNQLAFNSVSQLVSSQLNRYLGAAFSNVDVNFGVQGEDPNDLDLIYGIALRLLNERLLIRGEGVYTGDGPEAQQAEGPQGEFVVEVRLSPAVSAKVFYRRTGDELTRNRTLTSSAGAGLSFQTAFATWTDLFTRLFGWLVPSSSGEDAEEDPESVAQQPSSPPDSTTVGTNERGRPEW